MEVTQPRADVMSDEGDVPCVVTVPEQNLSAHPLDQYVI